MATFTPRGKRWQAQIAINGIRKAKTFDSKIEARQWARQVEARITEGEVESSAKKQDKTFADAALRYREEVSTGKKGERWEKVRINAFQRTVTFWCRSIATVTPEQIGQWRDQRKTEVSVGSVQREFNLIRSIFETARREWKWLKVNPCHDVRMPPRPKPRTRRIGDDEIRLILRSLGFAEGAVAESGYDEVAIAFQIALETAMRQSEIITLTWDQVFLDKRFLHLSDTKNGDERDVPLSTRAVELFEMLPQDRSHCFTISAELCSSLFRKARINAGLSGFTFHDSRREALSRMSKRLNVLQLARVVGHRNPKSLMIYYQESASEMAKLLD